MIRAALLFVCLGGSAMAQGTVENLAPGENPHGGLGPAGDPNRIVAPLTGEVIELQPVPAEPRQRVTAGAGAVVRWLDKVSGDVRDVTLAPGESQTLGRIAVTLGECRYPVNNPSGEAYAWLDIITTGREDADFSGWMLASSPALSALDHPRYDVWVIRCTTA
ncbi:MAG: DUF2155 domain-containing protein [Pseudomonadota bacterium]